MMTAEQHKQLAECATTAGRNPSTMTFEEVQSSARTQPTRKIFTVLHQEKAERGRKTQSLKWTTSGDWEREEED